jgi:cytochrome c2
MKYLFIIFSLFAISLTSNAADSLEVADQAVDQAAELALAAQVEAGEATFKKLCKACHSIQQRLVGPALKGVYDRRDEDWIIQFVQNSNEMIASGDEVAMQLFQDYNQIPMPNQPVTADEIRSVLAYIKDASIVKPSDGPKYPRPEVEKSNIKPLKFSDYRFWIIFTVTVGLLIIGVYYKAETEGLKKKLEMADD